VGNRALVDAKRRDPLSAINTASHPVADDRSDDPPIGEKTVALAENPMRTADPASTGAKVYCGSFAGRRGSTSPSGRNKSRVPLPTTCCTIASAFADRTPGSERAFLSHRTRCLVLSQGML
jgi:hypothetical protein